MADFPLTVHRPWVVSKTFHNATNDRPNGFRYAYNLSTTPQARYVIDFTISDTDATSLLSHFSGQLGSLVAFNFTDPETTDVVSVRYDQPRLEVRRVGPNENLINVNLLQVI